MKIVQLHDSKEKSRICEKVLRSLPDWFGIESAILDYIKDVQTMETWVAIESDAVGFISLNKHNQQTAEIHVIGLLPEFHGKKVGSELIRAAEESLLSQGFKFLTVKTLSESCPDVNYDKTRKFYLKSGFIPFEEFKTLWGAHNPCLMMAKALAPQQYAVIFSSKRNEKDPEVYEEASQKMLELAKNQNGFIGVESSRDSQGFGITVSYWRSPEDIKAWKSNTEHLEVQRQGRAHWYDSFTTTICRVERKYSFERGESNG
jgi:heme-degrading monooxygenase HmoA/GNAT superfamily N-acetyltransferase